MAGNKRIRDKSLIGEMKTGATPLRWIPLDNAAKIFPPTSHGTDTGVFRMSCELVDTVNPDILQRALDRALELFPHMLMVMRHGLFWYYLEQTTMRPKVVLETSSPCKPLYRDGRSLLFEISYWKNKVNLEVFHVLTDGSGAVAFLRAVIISYLSICHPDISAPVACDASVVDRREDSFQRYYQKRRAYNPVAIRRAYTLKGQKRPDGGIGFIEGVASVNEVLDAAHRYKATMTVYLSAALLCAISDGMYIRDRRRPVVLTIPVDLRSYFPSDTARNFFGTMQVEYNFSEKSGEFSDVVEHIAKSFKEELTPGRLAERMNQMGALEHNPFIRAVPLVVKNPLMRLASFLADRGETAVLSNVGRFNMPEQMTDYVKGLGIFMATHAIQLCVCTCSGKAHFGFSSAFADPAVQRNFFKRLVSDGVELEIRSTDFHKEDDE